MATFGSWKIFTFASSFIFKSKSFSSVHVSLLLYRGGFLVFLPVDLTYVFSFFLMGFDRTFMTPCGVQELPLGVWSWASSLTLIIGFNLLAMFTFELTDLDSSMLVTLTPLGVSPGVYNGVYESVIYCGI